MITEFDIDDFENALFGAPKRNTSNVMTAAYRPPHHVKRSRPVTVVGVIRRSFDDGTSIEETFLTNRNLHQQVMASCGCASQTRLTRQFPSPQELRRYLYDANEHEAQRLIKASSHHPSNCQAHVASGVREMTRFDQFVLIDDFFPHESIARFAAANRGKSGEIRAILCKTFADGSIVEQGFAGDHRLHQRVLQPCGCLTPWSYRRDFNNRQELREFLAELRRSKHLRVLRSVRERSYSCGAHHSKHS